MSYCDGCYKLNYCDFPCQQYLDYLSIISECLNGHENGKDPCPNCTTKGQFDCPIYGADKAGYKEHLAMLDHEKLPPI